MSYRDALAAAQEAGVMLSVSAWEYSADFDSDIIMMQSIPAGAEILTGSTIELVVSLGSR